MMEMNWRWSWNVGLGRWGNEDELNLGNGIKMAVKMN